jgi:hypothetical protein
MAALGLVLTGLSAADFPPEFQLQLSQLYSEQTGIAASSPENVISRAVGFFSGLGAYPRGLLTKLRFVTQKDRVVRASLFRAAAHMLYLNGESAMAQALFKLSILSGRPDGQHPVPLERMESGGYSLVVIEPDIV